MDRLHSTPADAHAQAVVATATRVLFLRTTTQIDELMKHASTAVQQRWDFLGPCGDAAQPPTSVLFAQIDNALEWQPGSSIGDYIRHAHYSMELTDQQQETLHRSAIRYALVDAETVHAYAPFAEFEDNDGVQATLAVVLVWEDDAWKYFDTRRLDLPDAGLHPTIDAAEAAFCASAAHDDQGDSDDAYWGQFPQPAKPAIHAAKADDGSGDSDDDYWNQHVAGGDADPDDNQETEHAVEPAQQQVTPIARSVQHSLAAAALAAQAAGMGETEFLQAAQRHYSSARLTGSK
ncbi:hypothetical protein LPJ61_003599 [Coemansia biformis]|uniref:Uncharacterized protein n=1 Tax=Coemansia biformis TaxID=1286918 RepID=A0A9W7YCI8_9FUNG|nr:hypothetical protein LPJ61_003599 [Coemansia biformis]